MLDSRAWLSSDVRDKTSNLASSCCMAERRALQSTRSKSGYQVLMRSLRLAHVRPSAWPTEDHQGVSIVISFRVCRLLLHPRLCTSSQLHSLSVDAQWGRIVIVNSVEGVSIDWSYLQIRNVCTTGGRMCSKFLHVHVSFVGTRIFSCIAELNE